MAGWYKLLQSGTLIILGGKLQLHVCSEFCYNIDISNIIIKHAGLIFQQWLMPNIRSGDQCLLLPGEYL